MQAPGSSPRVDLRSAILVVGVVAAVLGGAFASSALSDSPSRPTLSSGACGTSASNETSGSGGAPGSGGAVSVYSHAGTVNRGVSGVYGPASIYGHAWAIGPGPNVTTPALGVAANSRVFVFVGFNPQLGNGSVFAVMDSLGDTYAMLLGSNPVTSQTEMVYESGVILFSTSLNVTAVFSSDVTGASVDAVDVVATVGLPTVDVVYANNDLGGSAWVYTTTTTLDDLLLLGVSGAAGAAPFTGGPGETPVDSGARPVDAQSFATFSAPDLASVTNLTATPAATVEWAAVGVGIYGFEETSGAGVTTTPPFSTAHGSVIFLFVGYVNSAAGGGYVASVNDSLGDAFTLVAATGSPENHTEDLYVSGPTVSSTAVTVSVAFAGGGTIMGGSVAAVDLVAINGTPAVDNVNMDYGSWSGTACAVLSTSHSGDLLLLGVAGMGRDAPLAPVGNETLVDTGTNASGPWFDGTGFGIFSEPETGSPTLLAATLRTPAAWNAIAVGVYASSLSCPTTAVAAPGLATGLVAATPVAAPAVLRR